MEKVAEQSGLKGRYQCMKHEVYLSDENLVCRDPKLYCKYRSSCVIWFAAKKGANKTQ